MKKYTLIAVGVAVVGFAFSASLALAGTSTRCIINGDCPALGEVCTAGQCVFPNAATCSGSVTNNPSCSTGTDCISGSCTPVTCTVATGFAPGYSCGNGFTCNNPDTQQAVCSSTPSTVTTPTIGPSGNDGSCSMNANCNTLEGQVCLNPGASSGGQCGLPNGTIGGTVQTLLGNSTSSCADDINYNYADLQTCAGYLEAEAAALGYATNGCPITTEPTPTGSAHPYLYTSYCQISGTGALGSINDNFPPQDLVGESGFVAQGSNNWYTVEPVYGGSGSGGTTISGNGTITSNGGSPTNSGAVTTPPPPPPAGNVVSQSLPSSINNSVTNALNNIAPAFTSILSELSGSNTLAGTLSNNTSASSPTGAAPSSATGTVAPGGSCASTASATLSAVTGTLTGLLPALESPSIPASLLATSENLIQAVANVLNALGTCISAGN